MGNSFWILFAALNNLKPWHLTIAEVKVFSYSLCVTFCPLHYGVINGHRALDVTEKCLKVVWSHVLFPPWKCNTRYAILFFVPGDFQNKTWAPKWNWALKPATEKQPSARPLATIRAAANGGAGGRLFLSRRRGFTINMSASLAKDEGLFSRRTGCHLADGKWPLFPLDFYSAMS